MKRTTGERRALLDRVQRPPYVILLTVRMSSSTLFLTPALRPFAVFCPKPTSQENQNTRESLEDIKYQVLQQLSMIQGAPSVQMHEVPPDWSIKELDEVRVGVGVRGSVLRASSMHWLEFITE